MLKKKFLIFLFFFLVLTISFSVKAEIPIGKLGVPNITAYTSGNCSIAGSCSSIAYLNYANNPANLNISGEVRSDIGAGIGNTFVSSADGTHSILRGTRTNGQSQFYIRDEGGHSFVIADFFDLWLGTSAQVGVNNINFVIAGTGNQNIRMVINDTDININRSLIVGENLNVGRKSEFQDDVTFKYNQQMYMSGDVRYYNPSNNFGAWLKLQQGQMVKFMVTTNNFAIIPLAMSGRNYAWGTETNPTYRWYSITDPIITNTQWGEVQHNTTNFVIESGNGSFYFKGQNATFEKGITVNGISYLKTLNLFHTTAGVEDYITISDNFWDVNDRKRIIWKEGVTEVASIDAVKYVGGKVDMRFSVYDGGFQQDEMLLNNTGLYVEGIVASENATFNKDVIIDGILYGGSPVKIAGINITNNVFNLVENLNSSSRFTLQNINDGTNATAVISTINDVGGYMSIGIGSSNFMVGETNYNNATALFSRSRGETVFANLYNKSFRWLFNPLDDNDLMNLADMLVLNSSGLHIPRGSVFLGDFETSAQGGAKVVKRSNANGALFGISNPIAGANPTSGAGYITIQDCGNYTVDAHSSQDTNNPNDVVHHPRGCLVNEIWRLNPINKSSSFIFEDEINSPLFKINRTSTFVFNNFTIGSSANPINVTMFSQDGTKWDCGVSNAGVFVCS